MQTIPRARSLTATPSKWARSLIAVAALQLLACFQEALFVPPELAPAARLPVKGRSGWNPGQHLRFGEYQADRRESHFKQAVIGAVAHMIRGEAIEPFSYRLSVPGRDSWQAQCDPITQYREGQLVSDRAAPLRCSLAPETGDTSRTWRLTVLAAFDQLPHGDLVGPDARFDVVGTTRDDKGRVGLGHQAIGYHVLTGGRAVAAVEVLQDGAVWFAAELPPERRDLLAATAAALLLWDNITHRESS